MFQQIKDQTIHYLKHIDMSIKFTQRQKSLDLRTLAVTG